MNKKTIHILYPDCVEEQVQHTRKRFANIYTEFESVAVPGDAMQNIVAMMQGEPCDLLIVPDGALIASVLMPKWTDGYYAFAGNRMVLASTNVHKQIADDRVLAALTDANASFGYLDPTLDPEGYRAEMACLLADDVQAGLTAQLMEHPGRRVLRGAREPMPDYLITYATHARALGMPFAELPDEMNLSVTSRNEAYARARVDISGTGEQVMRGAAITHALTIPFGAAEPRMAYVFANMFLESDFYSAGFLLHKKAQGHWPPLPFEERVRG